MHACSAPQGKTYGLAENPAGAVEDLEAELDHGDEKDAVQEQVIDDDPLVCGAGCCGQTGG